MEKLVKRTIIEVHVIPRLSIKDGLAVEHSLLIDPIVLYHFLDFTA